MTLELLCHLALLLFRGFVLTGSTLLTLRSEVDILVEGTGISTML